MHKMKLSHEPLVHTRVCTGRLKPAAQATSGSGRSLGSGTEKHGAWTAWRARTSRRNQSLPPCTWLMPDGLGPPTRCKPLQYLNSARHTGSLSFGDPVVVLTSSTYGSTHALTSQPKRHSIRLQNSGQVYTCGMQRAADKHDEQFLECMCKYMHTFPIGSRTPEQQQHADPTCHLTPSHAQFHTSNHP